MALFGTHLAWALGASATAAWILHDHGVLSGWGALTCATSGTLGGLLPDVDADRSRPRRLLWTGLALAGALLAGLSAREAGRPGLVVPVAAMAFAGIRALGSWIFGLLTTHRGIWHSIPAACAWGLAWVWLEAGELGHTGMRGWWGGVFLGGGYLLHLGLDELSSVDIGGLRLKRSMGTALKLWCPRNPLGSLLLYGVLVGLAAHAWPR